MQQVNQNLKSVIRVPEFWCPTDTKWNPDYISNIVAEKDEV